MQTFYVGSSLAPGASATYSMPLSSNRINGVGINVKGIGVVIQDRTSPYVNALLHYEFGFLKQLHAVPLSWAYNVGVDFPDFLYFKATASLPFSDMIMFPPDANEGTNNFIVNDNEVLVGGLFISNDDPNITVNPNIRVNVNVYYETQVQEQLNEANKWKNIARALQG